MKTREQIEIEFEQLVHGEFTKEELTQKVTEIFEAKKPIEIDWDCYEDGGLSAYDAMFNSTDVEEYTDNEDLYCYGDIYWLPTKENNEQGVELYVVEVAIEWI